MIKVIDINTYTVNIYRVSFRNECHWEIWNWVENEDKYECFFAFSKIKSIFGRYKNIWESIYLIPRFHACQNITFKYLPLFFIDDGDARYLIKKVLQREIIKTYFVYYQMCAICQFIYLALSINSIDISIRYGYILYIWLRYNGCNIILQMWWCISLFKYERYWKNITAVITFI